MTSDLQPPMSHLKEKNLNFLKERVSYSARRISAKEEHPPTATRKKFLEGDFRVAFVSEGNPEDRRSWSGTPYGVFSAIKNLGCKVTWIAPKNSWWGRAVLWSVRCIDGCASRVLSRGLAFRRWPCIVRLLARRFKIDDSKYDLVVSIGITSCAFYRTRLPIIPVIDATFDCFNGYYGKEAFPIFAKFASKSDRLSAERSIFIIAASHWCKESLLHHYHTPDSKIRVFQLGANVVSVSNNTLVFPRKSEELRLLFIGFDTLRKGLKTAVEAVMSLRTDYCRNAVLDVVGTDGLEFHEKCSFVRFYGQLDKNVPEEMAKFEEIMASAHVFILPTRAECAGMVFSEAAAYGLPVFTCDTGGVGCYVENGGNGILLPVNAVGADFSRAIIECWDSGKFPMFSERGKLLFKEKLSWACWPQRLGELFGIIQKKG